MGIFDKLFGKKELKSKPKEPEQNSEKLMDSDSFGKLQKHPKQIVQVIMKNSNQNLKKNY